jgi:hypothetical protein
MVELFDGLAIDFFRLLYFFIYKKRLLVGVKAVLKIIFIFFESPFAYYQKVRTFAIPYNKEHNKTDR